MTPVRRDDTQALHDKWVAELRAQVPTIGIFQGSGVHLCVLLLVLNVCIADGVLDLGMVRRLRDEGRSAGS